MQEGGEANRALNSVLAGGELRALVVLLTGLNAYRLFQQLTFL
jgi:hypothetical protein